jgi:hypothetical protein
MRSATLKQRVADDADRIGFHWLPVLHRRIEGGTPTLDFDRAAQCVRCQSAERRQCGLVRDLAKRVGCA